MAINRVNFNSIGSGGDNPTAALLKLDANDADLDARVTANTGSSSGASTAAAAAQAAAVAAQASANAALLAQAINGTFRQKLINNCFDVWQRGGAFSSATLGGAFYTADCWTAVSVGNAISVNLTPVSPQGALPQPYAAQYNVTSVATSGNVSFFGQSMEDVRTFAGKRVCVTIEAWSSVAGKKIGVSLDQNFGTGGSPSASVLGAGKAITLGTTLTRQSVFIDVPDVLGKLVGTNNNDALSLQVWTDSHASNNVRSGSIGQLSASIYFRSISIEEVDITNTGQPTPLERLPLPITYMMCRRRFRTSFPFGTAPAQNAGIGGAIGIYASAANQSVSYYLSFDAPMRAAPTVTCYNPSAANSSWRNTNANTDIASFVDPAPSMTGFGIASGASGVIAGHRHMIHYAASADF